jgi:cell division transport system permease protein
MAQELSTNMVVIFFFDKAATVAEIKDIEQKVLGSPLVSGVKVIGAEEARDRFQKNFPDLKDVLANLKTNPFPPSLEARLKDTAPASREVAKLVQDVRRMKGVEDVQFNQDWVDKMQSLSRLAKAVGFFLGGILMLASFFIISNVIKLNVIARKNEIEILRLVGATNVFIRIPFLFEGIALGVMGSMVSLVFLLLAIKLFPVYIGSLGVLQQLLNFRYLSFSQALGLVAAGGAIGCLGSLSSVSKFLKT